MLTWEQVEATAADADRIIRSVKQRVPAGDWRGAAKIDFAARHVCDSLLSLAEIIGPTVISPREDLRHLASSIATRAIGWARELPMARGVE